MDRGLYSKYKGEAPIFDDDPKYAKLSIERKKEEDEKYNKLSEWYIGLPRGAVVYNRSATGQELFPGQPIFIIRGWGSRR